MKPNETAWSIPPWGTDPRQYLGQPLVAVSGVKIVIGQQMTNGYWILLDGNPYHCDLSLTQLATVLNYHQAEPVKETLP